ncbi:MAG: ABC transporter ATP-binding protein [Planctomycetota bacterium]
MTTPVAIQRAPETPPSASGFAVEARGLTKRYPMKQGNVYTAVDNVSLSIERGEIFGLVGPNGAGKTTLVKMLTTLLRPTAGSASLAGHDVVSAEREARKLVGLVTANERSFYWRLTGRHNLQFFASLYRIPKAEASTWIEELLDVLGLTRAADRRFDGYSTGMKQRLAIARGMLARPSILFMDEPTKGVDPVGSTELIELIRVRLPKIWQPTILITSHNLSEIEELCGRIAILNHGRLVAAGTMDELRAMHHPADRYRLRLARLSGERAQAFATSAGAAADVRVKASDNDTIELQASFQLGTDGLAMLLASIHDAGGRVEWMTSVRQSLQDILLSLVGQDNAARAGEER